MPHMIIEIDSPSHGDYCASAEAALAFVRDNLVLSQKERVDTNTNAVRRRAVHARACLRVRTRTRRRVHVCVWAPTRVCTYVRGRGSGMHAYARSVAGSACGRESAMRARCERDASARRNTRARACIVRPYGVGVRGVYVHGAGVGFHVRCGSRRCRWTR